MSPRGRAWQMDTPSKPLICREFDLPQPGTAQAVIRVAGCGICHTDLGFLHGGVRTRLAPPLTLGHEVAGTVEAIGPGSELVGGGILSVGQEVIVPAVLPCGDCHWCKVGRENICAHQVMPGNDIDGGFATHMLVPTRSLVPVNQRPAGMGLSHLSVVADAVTTPLQAMKRAEVGADDQVVVIGAGGIGIYAVQIAAAWGASVMAVDISEGRVLQARDYGAAHGVCTAGLEGRAARDAVQAGATASGWAASGWKIFEMSGTTGGQHLAWSLLAPGATLAVVGFTRDKLDIRLSNLMAFDADAFGSWGCRPSLYPEALGLIAEGRVQIAPFVSFHPLGEVNDVLERTHHDGFDTRPVLVPEEDRA
jgi:6-hydroxycyclohex-1-ene-1-carbonyl-CoA dehydrogenase